MNRQFVNTNSTPRAINDELLRECILKKHENTKEDIRLDTVTSIRLNFLNIIQIEHLCMLKSLSKLNLSHNKIETIENIDELVHLTELNLSFNRITKIENLENLNNIRVLSLNNNRIQKLENMNNLKYLTLFSIAENLIRDEKQFIYLRKFSMLKSLSLSDNPCCESIEFDSYIKAILPTIAYLNYVIVTPEEKFDCKSKFSILIKKLEQDEELLRFNMFERKRIENENEYNYLSFVEYLNDYELFDNMFDQDRQILTIINNTDILVKEYEDYKSFYGIIMKEFVVFGYGQHRERENEIKELQEVLMQAIEDSISKCKSYIEDFLSIWTKLVEKIISYTNEMQDNSSINKLCDELDENVSCLWEKLMNEEITLYEQCEETRNHFTRSIEELSYRMLNMGKIIFNKWRERELEWTFERDTIVKKIQKEEADEITNIQDDVTLSEAIILSETEHMQFINDREELLIARVQKSSNELINTINWKEINRNRNRILEIINLTEEKKSKVQNIRDYFNKNKADYKKQDILRIINL